MLPHWRGNDVDCGPLGGQDFDLLLEAVSELWEHCASTREDNIAIQRLVEVPITFHDGVEDLLVNSTRLHTSKFGVEKSLWASETLAAYGIDLPSGSSYFFSILVPESAIFSSLSKSVATLQSFSLMSLTTSRSAAVLKE